MKKFNKHCDHGDRVVVMRQSIFPDFNGKVGILNFNESRNLWEVIVPIRGGGINSMVVHQTADKIRKCRTMIYFDLKSNYR